MSYQAAPLAAAASVHTRMTRLPKMPSGISAAKVIKRRLVPLGSTSIQQNIV
jgi:hypothetical protein